MKSYCCRVTLVVLMFLAGGMSSVLAVPNLISFQGMLTDDLGGPLSGTHNIRFRLCETDVVTDPCSWSEDQTVEVSNGIYSVHLGSNTPFSIPVVFSADPLYLEVSIFNAGSSTWEPLGPRQRVVATPYALVSRDADTLDNQHASAFALASHNHDSRYYTEGEVNTRLAALEARIATLENLLMHFSRAGDEITISGANLHIVDGSGTTDGPVNGLGNVIVGYNEPRGLGDDRTGSHNLVVGSAHNYQSYGGLVAGIYNNITGEYASVSGGYGNTASGLTSSVSGGLYNTASGGDASVSGGSDNSAVGQGSSICGGEYNFASSDYASVSGGRRNNAAGMYSSVAGGADNISSGDYSSTSGGRYNQAMGDYAVVAGGGGSNDYDGNIAFAHYSAILGGLNNIAGDGTCDWDDLAGRFICSPGINVSVGAQATVSGGSSNVSAGLYASISGGKINRTSGINAAVSGGAYNASDGESSSVSGGILNTASGDASSVNGGRSNSANGYASTVGGGNFNTSGGGYASVSGGIYNETFASYASISGGARNTASGQASSVIGGRFNEAGGSYSTVTGGGGPASDGGDRNIAFADYSVISGGWRNRTGDPDMLDHTVGTQSVVSAGSGNRASGARAAVSGGYENTASGSGSSISGGAYNEVTALGACVSGGSDTTVSDNFDWAAADLYRPDNH